MDRLILPLLGACFLLILGAAAPLAWDRHPPVHYQLRVLGIRVAAFSLPESLATQRDAALAAGAADRRNLTQCRANTATLQAAMRQQNEAVEALWRDSQARVAVSAKAALGARAVAESYRLNAREILGARPAGADLCAAADALILQEAGR